MSELELETFEARQPQLSVGDNLAPTFVKFSASRSVCVAWQLERNQQNTTNFVLATN